METMTLMPMAAELVLDGRALPTTHASWTTGTACAGHVAIVHVNCPAAVASTSRHFGTKAYGTRRLGEHAST